MASMSHESSSRNADYNGSPGGGGECGKKRRDCEEGEKRTKKAKVTKTKKSSTPSYFTTTPLGFCVNEFLPIEKEKKTKHSPKFDFESLSDDIVGQCFFNGYLDTLETLKLTEVNKRNRSIGLTHIQHLDLRKCNNLTAKQVQKLSSTYQNLKYLDISYTPQFRDNHLYALVDASKNLRHLDLRGTGVRDDAVIQYLREVHNRFGQCMLETLDLSAVSKGTSYNIGDKTAEAISNYCPILKCLKLGWCKNLTDKGIASLTKLQHLTELDVSLTGITSQSCDNILHTLGPNLEVLDLSATSFFQMEDDAKDSPPTITFSKMKKLYNLKIQFCQDLTTATVEQIVQHSGLLRRLDVKYSGIQGTIHLTRVQTYRWNQLGIQLFGFTFPLRK